MTPAIFIDRDGTLIEEVNFLHRPDQVKLIPDVAQSVLSANKNRIPIIVVSNQSGVGRGFFTENDVQSVHQHINAILADSGAHIDDFYYCPHHIGSLSETYNQICDCRKPGSKHFKTAAEKFNIDLKQSVMIGDKMLDLQSAVNLDMIPVLVETGYGRETFSESELPSKTVVCGNAAIAIQWFINKINKDL